MMSPPGVRAALTAASACFTTIGISPLPFLVFGFRILAENFRPRRLLPGSIRQIDPISRTLRREREFIHCPIGKSGRVGRFPLRRVALNEETAVKERGICGT